MKRYLLPFTLLVLLFSLLFSSCSEPKTEKTERDLSDAVMDCWKFKWQRDRLINVLCKREGLDTLTWGTVNTVDSLIKVVNRLPPPANGPITNSNGEVTYPESNKPVIVRNLTLTIHKPIVIDMARGDLIDGCTVHIAADFVGDGPIDLVNIQEGEIPVTNNYFIDTARWSARSKKDSADSSDNSDNL